MKSRIPADAVAKVCNEASFNHYYLDGEVVSVELPKSSYCIEQMESQLRQLQLIQEAHDAGEFARFMPPPASPPQ